MLMIDFLFINEKGTVSELTEAELMNGWVKATFCFGRETARMRSVESGDYFDFTYAHQKVRFVWYQPRM